MKKLLIIMTLFMSSFFLFCRNEVKADALTYTYPSFIDYYSEAELNKRAAAETYSEQNSKPYYIFGLNGYYFMDIKPNAVYFTSTAIILSFSGSVKIDKCTYSSSNIKFSRSGSISSSYNVTLYSSTSSIDFSLRQYALKYTNIPNIKFSSSSSNIYSSVIRQYEDFSHEVIQGDVYLSDYDFFNLYIEYKNTEQENPHQEEIDKVNNFYTMVIEKIEYLANEISNNYILLFVIGIFIVTFVFLLIFRRFL